MGEQHASSTGKHSRPEPDLCQPASLQTPAITVRQAGLDDLDTLLIWRERVLREVFSLGEHENMDALMKANEEYYRAQIPVGGHIPCFALAGDEIVGCGGLCLYDEMPSPDNPSGHCGYVMNIYTAFAWRGRGVGEATMAWLMEEARAREVQKLYLETSEDGRSLYKALGFKPYPDLMKLPAEAAAES